MDHLFARYDGPMTDRDNTDMPNIIFHSGGFIAFGITTLLRVGINYLVENP